MKNRYLPLVLVASLLLLIGSVAAGCSSDDDNGNGGGEPLTLDAWFGQLETLSQAYDDDLDTLDEEAEANFGKTDSEDEAIEVFVSFVKDMRSATDDFVGDLDDLSAPSEVAADHSEAVTAGQEVVSLYGDALTVLDLAETFEDATLVLEGPGFVDAQDRFSAACVALQDFADSSGIDVDLSCPNGRSPVRTRIET